MQPTYRRRALILVRSLYDTFSHTNTDDFSYLHSVDRPNTGNLSGWCHGSNGSYGLTAQDDLPSASQYHLIIQFPVGTPDEIVMEGLDRLQRKMDAIDADEARVSDRALMIE